MDKIGLGTTLRPYDNDSKGGGGGGGVRRINKTNEIIKQNRNLHGAYLVDLSDGHGTKGVVQKLENHSFGDARVNNNTRTGSSNLHGSRLPLGVQRLLLLVGFARRGSFLLRRGTRGDLGRLAVSTSFATFFLWFGENAVWWGCDESVRMIVVGTSNCTFGRTRLRKVGHGVLVVARAFAEEEVLVVLGHVLHGEFLGVFGPASKVVFLR